MYESHFQFHARPFVAAPQAQHYVPTTALEQARQTLTRCVERAEGPGLIVGPAGSGKTLLCQLLADHFRRQHFQVAMLASARVSTRRALLQNILFEMHLPYRGMEEGELRLSLIDHLEPRGNGVAGLLLVVDEAHALPLKLLEEIRLISNFIRDGQPRVRLVLAGNTELEERLASHKLESLQQRIAARCYLQPMNREETVYYIREQVARAGGSESLFTIEALQAVHTATDGVPRLVNQVCDHALVLSALGGHSQLGMEAIEEAWSDLQQLPAPWHQTSQKDKAAPTTVVEFGELPDLDARECGTAAKTLVMSSPANPLEEAPTYRDIPDNNVEVQVSENLDRIDCGLGALDSAEGIEFGTWGDLYEDAVEFEPVGEDATQVELTFHTPANPFGDGFDEEEIVIDHYANLAASHAPGFSKDQDSVREVAAQIVELARQSAKSAHSIGEELPVISEAAELQPVADAIEIADLDPVLPEADMTEVLRVHIESEAELQGFNPARDPVLPEETSIRHHTEPRRPLGGKSRPQRREYRTLFSTLRNR